MTQRVADETIARFARQQHDWMERVLKGSLSPRSVTSVVQELINQGRKSVFAETRLLRPIAVTAAVDEPPSVAEFIQKQGEVSKSFREDFDFEVLAHQPTPGRLYVSCSLKEQASPQDIIKELPKNYLSSLGDIAGFIDQPRTTAWFLLNNHHHVNHFHVLNRRGEERIFSVQWDKEEAWWGLCEMGLDDKRARLLPGDRICFPDPLGL